MIDVHAWGPFWWAINWDPPERRLYPTWFKEVEEPYRYGQGLGLRIGTNAIEFGLCRPTKRPTALDRPDPEEIRFWGWQEEEIRVWQEEYDRQHLEADEDERDWADL